MKDSHPYDIIVRRSSTKLDMNRGWA